MKRKFNSTTTDGTTVLYSTTPDGNTVVSTVEKEYERYSDFLSSTELAVLSATSSRMHSVHVATIRALTETHWPGGVTQNNAWIETNLARHLRMHNLTVLHTKPKGLYSCDSSMLLECLPNLKELKLWPDLRQTKEYTVNMPTFEYRALLDGIPELWFSGLRTLVVNGDFIVRKEIDIKAIEHCKDLVVLELWFFSKISGLDSIQSCEKLQKLTVSNVTEQTSVLSCLPRSVRTLRIIECPGIDLYEIGRNGDKLREVQITLPAGENDLTFMEQCHKLEELYIDDACTNKGSMQITFEGLANCKLLRKLHLHGITEVSDMSPLYGCQLTDVSLTACDTRCTTQLDLTSLNGLVGLTELSLEGFKSRVDVSPLQNLTNLQRLNLEDMPHVVNSEPLDGRPSLQITRT